MCNGFRSRQMYDEKDASRFEQILSFLSCRNDRMVADIVLEKQYEILSFRHATHYGAEFSVGRINRLAEPLARVFCGLRPLMPAQRSTMGFVHGVSLQCR